MNPESEKPLRLFVNPFAIWTEFAFKTGEAMLATAHAAALRANAPKVGVIPTADAPTPKAPAPAVQPVRPAAKPVEALLTSAHAAALRATAKVAQAPVRQASKAARFKATRAKVRSKANAKRRTKR